MGYFERALLAAIVIGAGAGFVGALVVLRRRTFFAQALTHGDLPRRGRGGRPRRERAARRCRGIRRPRRGDGRPSPGCGARGRRSRRASSSPAASRRARCCRRSIPGLPVRADSLLVGSILTVTDGDILLAASVALVARAAGCRLRQGDRVLDVRSGGLPRRRISRVADRGARAGAHRGDGRQRVARRRRDPRDRARRGAGDGRPPHHADRTAASSSPHR